MDGRPGGGAVGGQTIRIRFGAVHFSTATMAPPPEQEHGDDDAIRSIRGGYIVSKLPSDVSKQSIVAAMQKAAESSMTHHQHPTSYMYSAQPSSSSSLDIVDLTCHVDLRPNPADPISSYAFVTPLWLKDDATRPYWVEGLEWSLLADGLRIGDTTCKVKKRRPPKRERIAQNEQREASKRRARERARANRPRWQPELLDKFDARDHSLDPHIFVANLDRERLRLIEEVYLPFVFPKSCRDEVIGALRHVWTNHPKSLRVKEMFETLEAFRLIEKQISLLMARRREEQKADQLTTIYDLACGHGLLGVVLAYRFADVRVVCVDMERRTCFDHYLEGFQLHGKAAEGEAHPLSNLAFLEQDFTTLGEEDIGGSSSFITMIHGCNEATKLAIEMAQKHGAAYAFMPCCIRDGLYGNVSRVAQVDDATRHTVMVGLVAGQYGSHLISAIDQRITNRNLIIFGGYSLNDGEEGASVGGDNEVMHGVN